MTDSFRDDEALDWFVRLNGNEDPQTLDDFQTWQAAHPANAAAFDRVAVLWKGLGQAESLDEALDHVPAQRPSRPAHWPASRLAAGWGLALAACAAIGVLILALDPFGRAGSAEPVVYASNETAPATRLLEDGTRIALGARSRVDVTMTRSARSVSLVSGEAFFDVTSDADRPFIIMAGTSEIRVVGTAFDVQRGAGALRVSVQEGRVEFRSDGYGLERLAAGDQILLSDGRLERSRMDPAAVGSWQSGRLVYRDMPLDIIAADLERYRGAGRLIVGAGAQDLRFTATFETANIDSAIEALAIANNLTVTREANGDVRLDRP